MHLAHFLTGTTFRLVRLGIVALAFSALSACIEPSPAQKLRDAQALLEKGERRSALIHLKGALQRQPDLYEARLLLGTTLLALGDPSSALIELRKAREGGLPDDQTVPSMAAALLLMQQYDRLLSDFGDAELTAKPARAELKALIATAYGLKGKLELAEASAKQALEADPGNLSAQLVLIRVQASGGQLAQAQQSVDRVIKAHPNNSAPLLLRAELLAAQGVNDAELLRAYSAVLDVEQNHILALGVTVALLGRQSKFEEAQATLAQMLKAHTGHPLALFHAALLAAQQGDMKVANEKAQALIKLTPDHPRALHLAGLIAYQRGSYLEASAMLGKALQRTESRAEVRTLLARTFLKLGEPSRSLTVIGPMLEADATGSDAFAVAAEAHLALGDTKAAQSLFEKAVAKNPDDRASSTALALARAGDVQPEVTDAALRTIGNSDPGVVADMSLIAVRVSRRQWSGALEAIDALERKQPGTPLPLMLRGRIALLQGNRDTAREFFEAALGKDAQYMPAVSALATLDVEAGQLEAAVARYQALSQSKSGSLAADMAIVGLRAGAGVTGDALVGMIGDVIKRHPNDAQPRLALIRARIEAGDVKRAIDAAQEGVAKFPDEAAFFDLLSKAHQADGNFNQAIAAANKLAALQPNSPLPHMRLAELDLAARDVTSAITKLNRALAVREDFSPAQSALAGVLASSGKFAEARAVAKTVQRQRPGEALGWVLAGDIEVSAKQPAAAIAAYKAALLLTGRSGDAAKRLHGAYMRAKMTADARDLEVSWLATQPNDTEFRLYLGEVAMQLGDFARAEKYLADVVRLQPNNVMALNNLAWSQLQLSKPLALETIEKAQRLAPKSPAVLDTMASILAEAGKLDLALTTQQQAVSLAPDYHQHRLNLARYLMKLGKGAEARSELDRLSKLGDKFPAQAEVKALIAKL